MKLYLNNDAVINASISGAHLNMIVARNSINGEKEWRQ